jgi:anion-transporting  ArsA/GET3 family ATPase
MRRPWFDQRGRLALGGALRRPLERLADRVVGLGLVREIAEFLTAFEPLFAGFRQRASAVEALLTSARTRFVLVSGPDPQRVSDVLFFARALTERGMTLDRVVINRVHPRVAAARQTDEIAALSRLRVLGERGAAAIDTVRTLLGARWPVLEVPLLANEPASLDRLVELSELLSATESRSDSD